jgi:hypothetical protein
MRGLTQAPKTAQLNLRQQEPLGETRYAHFEQAAACEGAA